MAGQDAPMMEKKKLPSKRRMPWYEYLPSGYSLKHVLLLLLLVGVLIAVGIGDSWLAVHA